MKLASTGLELHDLRATQLGCLKVDFLHPKLTYHLSHTSYRSEQLAKALGINAQYKPRIIDATAGLGHDSFLLVHLGCSLTLIERSAP